MNADFFTTPAQMRHQTRRNTIRVIMDALSTPQERDTLGAMLVPLTDPLPQLAAVAALSKEAAQ